MDRLKIQHLVIDVRSNGGGDAGISTLLTQYLVDKKFKIADSLYTLKRTSRYRDHIQWQRIYWLMTRFVTRKRQDGKYHFGYFERHYFKPRKRHHYNGNIYLLTGGNSFSATTLVLKALQGQSNVKIIGEETGGGAYGNTAWMIPDAILPKTGVRFRLPKFRLVMDKELVKDGRGIMPDIQVRATPSLILRGIDPKIEVVKDIIKKSQPTTTQRK
jgi:C-terminal processing protease CtpA/Prc